MGKSEKSKLRTQIKKEQKERLAAASEVVRLANAIENPLDNFPAFKTFKLKNSDTVVNIEYSKVDDLDKSIMDWILDLEERNMKDLYNGCSWGWNKKKKNEEMKNSKAKYLIAKIDDRPVAFTHFRFDLDYGDEVLYCYELQLEEEVRRKGVGKFLMQILELIGFKNNMRKVMLTVLKDNVGAVEFFKAMNYTRDETNLEESPFEIIPYEIISKMNKRLLPGSVKKIE